jgi:hypothetical protein
MVFSIKLKIAKAENGKWEIGDSKGKGPSTF